MIGPRGQIRTDTTRILSPLPLPVGLLGDVLAESVGFELTRPEGPSVFKAAPIVHSGNFPFVWRSKWDSNSLAPFGTSVFETDAALQLRGYSICILASCVANAHQVFEA